MKRSGFKEGYIARFFAFLTRFVYEIIPLCYLGRMFTSYRTCNQYFQRSLAGRLTNHTERGGSRLHRTVRRNIALSVDKSIILWLFRGLMQALLRCSLRTVGLFFITSGSYSAMMYWLFSVVWANGVSDVISLYAGIGAILLGILLLFSDMSLGYALFKGLLFGRGLATLFGVSTDVPEDMDRAGRQGYVIAVPLGMVLGALSALISPARILLAVLAFFAVFLVLSIPESGVMLLAFALPFVGFLPQRDLWLGLAVALICIAYVGKLLRGNRTFRMEVQDLPVLLLLLLFALSGVSVAGVSAWRGALFSALLLLVYFLAVNLIATTQWLRRCRVALVCSATLASLVGVVQLIVGAVLSDAAARTLPQLGAFVRAGFDDRTTFSYFLVLAFPFALCSFITAKKQLRVLFGFSCLAMIAAVVMTWVQSAMIALLVMLIVFFLIFERRTFPFFLSGAILLPVISVLMPRVWQDALLRMLQADSKTAIIRSTSAGSFLTRVFFEGGSDMFGRGAGFSRLAFGLGNGGVERFCVLYTSVAPHTLARSLNFWSYSLLERGLFGVIVPIVFFLLLFQNCFSVLHEVRGRDKRLLPIAGIAMCTGVLVLSIFRYAWYDPAALCAFSMASGLVVACMRFEREHSHRTAPDEMTDTKFCAELDYYGAKMQ